MSELTQCVNCGFGFIPDEYLTNRCPNCGWRRETIERTIYTEHSTVHVSHLRNGGIETDPIPAEALNEINQMTTSTVNEWLQNAYGLPLTVSINRLALVLVGMLKDAYIRWSKQESQK